MEQLLYRLDWKKLIDCLAGPFHPIHLNMELEKGVVISVLDETIPPCRECEKHFFNQRQTFNWIEAGVVLISIMTLIVDLVTGRPIVT